MGHIGQEVVLDAPAFVHDTALLYGKITISEGASIFPHVVMRSEVHEIKVGKRTNIQDFAMIHVGDYTPTVIGEDCSICTRATLRGCTIGDRCLIGIGATVMDGAKIGENSIVAAHALVDKNVEFGPNSIIAGVPATRIGERDNSNVTCLNSAIYAVVSETYSSGQERFSDAQVQQIVAAAQAHQWSDRKQEKAVEI